MSDHENIWVVIGILTIYRPSQEDEITKLAVKVDRWSTGLTLGKTSKLLLALHIPKSAQLSIMWKKVINEKHRGSFFPSPPNLGNGGLKISITRLLQ